MKQKSMLEKALKEKYCIPAFNFTNFEIFKCIIEECERLNSTVILQVSEGALKYFGQDFMKCFIARINDCSVPVSLHLDHGKSFEVIKAAIDIGFDSVMIDASMLPYEENIKLTKQVCDYAHSKNVSVEAELGQIKGDDDNADFGQSVYTNPQKAKDFVLFTGIDSLAVAIGTNHGANKYAKNANLRFDILSEIEKQIPGVPLVLHGASLIEQKYVDLFNQNGGNLQNAKGNDNAIEQIYKTNICKINMDTDLRLAYTAAIREYLKNHPESLDPREYNKHAMQYVKQVIADRIVNICHSNMKNC